MIPRTTDLAERARDIADREAGPEPFLWPQHYAAWLSMRREIYEQVLSELSEAPLKD